MAWLAPGAFAAVALLGGPLIVHLLARRNVRRLLFPATHFVRPTHAAAVRLRRPSDVGLMLLRMAIVGVAVLAAAQPLLLSRWRLACWNHRTARAVIVDISRAPGGQDQSESAVANRLGDEALHTAFAGKRFDTSALSDGIGRAVDWLRAAPPARREIVIVSGFQSGALDAAALASIPAGVGVRLIRAGSQPIERTVAAPGLAGWRGGVWDAAVTVDWSGTRVSWRRRGDAIDAPWLSLAAAPADGDAAKRALAAAWSLGVAAGDPSRRVAVRFAGAPGLAPAAQEIHSPWIAAAALALRRSDLIEDPRALTIAEQDGLMIVDAAIPVSALEAAALVRAVALAVRPAPIVRRDAEVVTWSDAELARWRRDSAPVARTAISTVGETDARWPWAIALALLVVEWRVRRPGVVTAERRAHADAA